MKIRHILLVTGISVISIGQSQIDNTSKQIIVVEKKHEFSSESTQDIFRLTVNGKNIFDAVVTFQILKANGQEIYNVCFTTGDLMEFGSPETDKGYKRSKEDSISIIAVLNQFFDERNFTKPAVQDTSEMKDNYSSFENWNLIREDSTTTGFIYQLGAEGGRKIAYSKKKNKVILYFTCC